MAAIPVDVVGSTPITFTGSQGQQRVIPLSALQFNGSTIELKQAWSSALDPSESEILIALATAHAAAGRLKPPSLPPPSPAVVVAAAVPGPESNNISVTVTPDDGTGLSTKVKFDVLATDTYDKLTSAKSAAMAIGVDSATGNTDDPAAGTGVVVVQMAGAPFDDEKLPVAQSGSVTAVGCDVTAEDESVLFTLKPRGGYEASGGLTFTLELDEEASNFTLTATYDSTAEEPDEPDDEEPDDEEPDDEEPDDEEPDDEEPDDEEPKAQAQDEVALTDLASLPPKVAFLITAGAPPSGVLPPTAATVQLTGGGPGLAANAVLYT